MSKEIENKNKREVDMMKYMFRITRKDSGAFYEFRIATYAEMKDWIDFQKSFFKIDWVYTVESEVA